MCNRYSQTKRERDLTTNFGTLHLSLEPRYNIAPTNVVTVAFAEERTNSAGEPCLPVHECPETVERDPPHTRRHNNLLKSKRAITPVG